MKVKSRKAVSSVAMAVTRPKNVRVALSSNVRYYLDSGPLISIYGNFEPQRFFL
jgi:hypothetical protein